MRTIDIYILSLIILIFHSVLGLLFCSIFDDIYRWKYRIKVPTKQRIAIFLIWPIFIIVMIFVVIQTLFEMTGIPDFIQKKFKKKDNDETLSTDK